MLADTGITWPYGSLDGPPKRVLANDLFRAVHDAFGRGLEGAGFRARGEENAWQAHVRLFTGSAVAAITTETRGQNSWLNYGPYGERNRTAKVEDTIFADQKTGLMPEWTWTEGRAADMPDQVLEQGPVAAPTFETTYTDAQGERFNITLRREVLGMGADRQLSVIVEARTTDGNRRGMIDFAVQGNTLAAENTIVAPAYRRRGLAEAMYRAAREAGYDIMPGRKQTADGERMVASLREKGVINVERGLEQGPRGTFNPERLLITLNETADLSTFLHESGHFFLEVLADLASQPDAPQQIKDDMAATLKWFGVPDLETWNSYTLEQKRPYHERWAESFEQYLFEGKAPSQELQPLFRRFRSWLVNIYKSLKQFMQGRNLQLGDDIRQVFDRLIATDEQIAQAEEAAGMLPDFEATNEAIEKLQARSLRDLKWTVNARNKALKALQKQAAKLRKEVEAEVRAEVEQQPIYRAMRWLKKGETTDPETGDLVKAEKGYRLSTDALAEMYPETVLGRPDLTRLRGMTAKNGLHPDLVADMFGFASGDQLVRALLDAQPIDEVIEGMTDQRMLERHGDLATPEAREAAANEAVHNEARARALATELKSQAEMINQRQDTGRRDASGRAITVNAVVEAAKQFGLNLAARRRIKDLKNAAWQHRAAEARAGKRWQQLTAEGKTEEAVQAKRDQLLNNYAAKALQDAQAEVKKTLEFFRKVTKDSNEKIVERGRDPDVVNAMRAILAAYGVAPRLEKSALAYMETVAKNDPAMYAALKPSVDSALLNAKPLDELTLEELRGLNDELRAMWELAKRSRQMEVDGNLLDIEDAADELLARMQEIGIPDEIPGERAAITDREEAGIKLQFAKAILSRVEQWAERMDGKFGGPFLRLVFQPIKEAADAYRTARVDYRKRFTALLENIAPILRPGAIPAPELGYTFGNARDSGQAELLHAILHTGNESNKRKLLLGRGWATELEDGTLDTSRWDAFIARMINEGKLEKAHYDFAQGVWDLLEEMKPRAQETHRKVFGRYFAEVTATPFDTPFDTPFGSYRGGYVPAQVDPRIVKDAKLREMAEAENESMAYAFPASPSGFTKARVEYNKPLLLDLRALAQHMDKVLLFSYMQGPVTDVRRLLTNKRVSYALDRIDPGAYEGMLIPWLNRAAKQIVETPVAGDRKLSRFLSAARSRAGMALMFANLSNTFQQITGFSMAAVKVKPSLMMKATASFIADPKVMKEQVATASEYMRNRMLNEVAAMNDAVEQILVNATALEKAQAWTQRHAYFLQAAVDNTMSPIIWTAAYNQAIEQQMNHKDAVRFADGVIRQTQGTTLPEDISRFESGPAYARLFTQFVSYFNMMANTNATAMKQIVDEMGLRKGAGRLLYAALAGLLVPIWVAEAIALAFRGGPEDKDDDGWLDDWLMAVFGMGTLRGLTAQVPIAGQAAQLVVNRFNDNPADDKFSLSPAVSLLESAVSSPASVYKAIVDDGNAQKAVRDVAAAATLITGLPIYAAARPIGYLAGVADERIEPTGPVDLARGLVTGTASPESRAP
jgi:ribosomal protein S18 acetylase RimI-like enzyme